MFVKLQKKELSVILDIMNKYLPIALAFSFVVLFSNYSYSICPSCEAQDYFEDRQAKQHLDRQEEMKKTAAATETKIAQELASFGWNLENINVAWKHLNLYFDVLAKPDSYPYANEAEAITSIGLLLSGDSPLAGDMKYAKPVLDFLIYKYDNKKYPNMSADQITEAKIATMLAMGQIANNASEKYSNLIVNFLSNTILKEGKAKDESYSVRRAAVFSLASLSSEYSAKAIITMIKGAKSSWASGDDYLRFYRDNNTRKYVFESYRPEGFKFSSTDDKIILVDLLTALDIKYDDYPDKVQFEIEKLFKSDNKTVKISAYALAIKRGGKGITSDTLNRYMTPPQFGSQEFSETGNDLIRMYQDIPQARPWCKECANRRTFWEAYDYYRFRDAKLKSEQTGIAYSVHNICADRWGCFDASAFDDCRHAAFESVMLDMIFEAATSFIPGKIEAKLAQLAQKAAMRGAKALKAHAIARTATALEKAIQTSGDVKIVNQTAMKIYKAKRERIEKIAGIVKKAVDEGEKAKDAWDNTGGKVLDYRDKVKDFTTSYDSYLNGGKK